MTVLLLCIPNYFKQYSNILVISNCFVHVVELYNHQYWLSFCMKMYNCNLCFLFFSETNRKYKIKEDKVECSLHSQMSDVVANVQTDRVRAHAASVYDGERNILACECGVACR